MLGDAGVLADGQHKERPGVSSARKTCAQHGAIFHH